MLNQITSRLNALKKVSRISNFKTRKMIANGIVISKFIYLVQIWGGTSEFLISLLQKLQNQAARLVTKLDWRTPVSTLLRQCGWLSIQQLYAYHSLVQILKVKSEKRPEYINEKFSKGFGHHTRLSSNNCIRIQNHISSDLGKQNFTYKAALLWNKLPPNIKQCSTLKKFKISLKEWVKKEIPLK